VLTRANGHVSVEPCEIGGPGSEAANRLAFCIAHSGIVASADQRAALRARGQLDAWLAAERRWEAMDVEARHLWVRSILAGSP
jgi:hypothetical protein